MRIESVELEPLWSKPREVTDHWSVTAMGEREYNSVPSVMDKASEQRIDTEYITWDLNLETSTANTKVS